MKLKCAICFVFLVGVSLLTIGCQSESSSKTQGKGSKTGKEISKVKLAVPSDEECKKLMESMIKACNDADASTCNTLVDQDTFYQKITAGVDAPKKVKEGFVKGVKSSRFGSGGILSGVIQQAKSGAKLSLLNVKKKGNQKVAVLRMLPRSGGVNYLEFSIAKFPSGDVKFTDVYPFMAGEKISHTMNRLFLMSLTAQNDRSFWDRLSNKESKKLKSLKKMQEAIQAFSRKDFTSFKNIYNGLDEQTKKEKMLLLFRMQATGPQNPVEYKKVIDDFLRWHPADPAVDMILLDAYTLKEEFQKAIKTIDRLEKKVGKDPYLSVLRSSIYMQAKDWKNSQSAAENAFNAEPELRDSYTNGLEVAVYQSDFTKAIKWLERFKKQFPNDYKKLLPALKQIKEIRPLFQSKEYQDWAK